MELVFIFPIVLIEVSLVNFPEVMKVIGTFGVYAFMDGKVLSVFLWDECIAAMGAAQLHGREAAILRGEPCRADFAQELAFRAVVFVQERLWGITAGAGAAVGDIAF